MAQKKYSKLNLYIPLTILIAIFIFVSHQIFKPSSEKNKDISVKPASGFWKYECIDTMKTSRDKARLWENRPDLEDHIEMEMRAIKDMGANCVAIDTPYDEEFKPYLKKWINAARRNDLRVWYRGNWAGWEGWFDYPENLDSNEHLEKTEDFILDNQELFLDGDIFTACPECENGGPFDQVELEEHQAYRNFLIDEYFVTKKAFETIDKDVEIGWLSMNGGLAKRMFDQKTVDMLGKEVSIDHYINDPKQMGEYIKYFADVFGAKVSIGEFGAPVPEINGEMTEIEQAIFVEELMKELYRYRKFVSGISYWDLYDGSTALLNSDGSPRLVAKVIKKYFTPGYVEGVISDQNKKPLSFASIRINEESEMVYANEKGEFMIPLIEGEHELIFGGETEGGISKKVIIESGKKTRQNITLSLDENNLIYKVKQFFDFRGKID